METERKEAVSGWVCVDCIMLVANGETPPEMSEDETAEWLADMDDTEVTYGHSHEDCDHGAEDYDEISECETQSFSWSSCDLCASGLGGSRHAVTFWVAS